MFTILAFNADGIPYTTHSFFKNLAFIFADAFYCNPFIVSVEVYDDLHNLVYYLPGGQL